MTQSGIFGGFINILIDKCLLSWFGKQGNVIELWLMNSSV